MKQLGPIRQRVEENSQRITKLEEDFGRQNTDIDCKIQAKVEEVIADTIKEQVEEVWELQKERTNRANNILLAQVPESGEIQGQQRMLRRQRESYGNSQRVGFKFG